MSKGNPQKKMTFEDRFIKHWCASYVNHPEGWSWWKRKNRKEFRHIMKNELRKEIQKYI